MLEDVPRHGPGLADELRKAGRRDQGSSGKGAGRSLSQGPGRGDTDCLALGGARCVCEGADVRGGDSADAFVLAVQEAEAQAGRCVRRSERSGDGPPRVEFEVFEPEGDGQVRSGTVTRAKAACLCCGAVLPPERVRAQLFEQRGGADAIFDGQGKRIGGARMTAGGDAQARREGPSLPAAGRCRLRGGAQGAVAACRHPRRVGSAGEAGAVSGAGRAVAAGRHVGLSRTAVRDAAMGRSVHGAAEDCVGGVGKADCRRTPG